MSRLDYLTIVIVAVCVAALIYLIYMTTNLLGGEPEAAVANTEEQVQQDFPEEDTLTYGQGYYEGADTSSAGAGYGAEETYAEGAADEEYATPAYEEAAETGERAPLEQQAPSYSTVGKGEYMVLAGTFRYKANAEAMQRSLEKMGYSGSSVELFDRGAYAVVLVGRYADLSDARALKAELSGKGVQAYVQQKQ